MNTAEIKVATKELAKAEKKLNKVLDTLETKKTKILAAFDHKNAKRTQELLGTIDQQKAKIRELLDTPLNPAN
jgi:hypothetical protein